MEMGTKIAQVMKRSRGIPQLVMLSMGAGLVMFSEDLQRLLVVALFSLGVVLFVTGVMGTLTAVLFPRAAWQRWVFTVGLLALGLAWGEGEGEKLSDRALLACLVVTYLVVVLGGWAVLVARLHRHFGRLNRERSPRLVTRKTSAGDRSRSASMKEAVCFLSRARIAARAGAAGRGAPSVAVGSLCSTSSLALNSCDR